ncbi:MAG: N-acetylmuramoyl-L-alanine amidase [Clostridia bacterium]|nr:N-acetylmuramoyl-L-alanine amidase [Clostridia bacterium]
MKKSVFAVSALLFAGIVTAVSLCISVLLSPKTVFSGAEERMRIVLDAGHGGIDGGVSGRKTGVKESDINLAIAMEVKEALADLGFEVVLTRKTEAGLYDTTAKGFKKRDMQRRKEIIQEANPLLVVSVHQNFYASTSVRGAQVFYKKGDDKGKKLATALQSSLNGLYEKEGVKKRSPSAGQYFMVECTDNPSVIVECGFLSNEKDERLLSSAAWQKQLAASLAAGIMAYLSEYTA